MRRFALPSIVLAVCLTGCAPSPSEPGKQSLPAVTSVPGMARYALAEPIQMNNVTIIPVVSNEAQTPIGPEYATLAEAKKNAWIEIIEKPGEGEVSELQVRNVGKKPILLLSGDLLLGGKQDRVVSKDTIVPPGETVEVPVYCVEPGRWSGASDRFSYADTTVPMMVKKEAAFGGQSQVWQEVGRFNANAGAGESERSTVQEGLNRKQVQDHIGANFQSVKSKLGRNVVGLMFLVDGEIKTLELFGNNRLFSASADSLLRGALAQSAVGAGRPASKVDLTACATFMADAMKSSRVVESRADGSVNARRASPASRGMELHFDDQESQKSGLLHGTYTKQ